MELAELINEALKLTKKDKMRLVNEVLVSMSSKDGRKMPVYRALEVFGDVYRRFKNTEYNISKPDYKWMHDLLLKIETKVLERQQCEFIDDDALIDNLKAYLTAVRNMSNSWYFANRFTPEGLSKDFQKIYGNISNRSSYHFACVLWMLLWQNVNSK